jgi:hypothetical protein
VNSSPSPSSASPLWCLLAGALLTLAGVAGFLYESSFATGASMVSDEIAGTVDTNGWSNAIHLLAGLAALAAASRRPRQAALALGGLLTVLALWGIAVTDHGIGAILDAVPVDSAGNFARLMVGGTGLLAGLADRPPDPTALLARLHRQVDRRRERRGRNERRGRATRGG